MYKYLSIGPLLKHGLLESRKLRQALDLQGLNFHNEAMMPQNEGNLI